MLNVLLFCQLELSGYAISAVKAIPAHTFRASDPTAFSELAAARIYDVWIVATRALSFMPDGLSEILQRAGETPVILLVPPDQADKLAAYLVNRPGTYLVRETATGEELALVAKRGAEEKRVKDEVRFLRGGRSASLNLGSIVTRNVLMEQVLDRMKAVAPTDTTVLLEGETGTGKELLARVIHTLSPRRDRPFVAVNCGALPDPLIESELFGYERGAFTGAGNRRIGKLEYAQGGTVFLDEVGTMSSALQVRLLRVLQEPFIQRLGSNVDVPVDFRVIAATNEDLSTLVKTGVFRRDLFYRLMVFPLSLPPLRERREDIPLLASHFLERARLKGRKYVKGISPGVMEQMVAYSWPGNVRELENVIERAVILATEEEIDDLGIVVEPTSDRDTKRAENVAFTPGVTLRVCKLAASTEAERRYLTALLQYTGGRIGEAARLAGLSPRALYEKMRYHGLRKENFRKSEAPIPIGRKPRLAVQ